MPPSAPLAARSRKPASRTTRAALRQAQRTSKNPWRSAKRISKNARPNRPKHSRNSKKRAKNRLRRSAHATRRAIILRGSRLAPALRATTQRRESACSWKTMPASRKLTGPGSRFKRTASNRLAPALDSPAPGFLGIGHQGPVDFDAVAVAYQGIEFHRSAEDSYIPANQPDFRESRPDAGTFDGLPDGRPLLHL